MFKRAIGFSCLLAAVMGGRPRVACGGEEPFTIVALPDTQYYSAHWPTLFSAQTQWIVDNKQSQNIVFVTHLGDITNRSIEPYQWANAQAAMSKLDGVVPYNAVCGNHDNWDLFSGGTSKAFLDHYGPARFAGQSWYGGASPSGFSSYQKIEAGARDFVMLTLDINADDDELAWAQGIIDANPRIPTILTTHDYLDGRGRGNRASIYMDKAIPGKNSGQAIWQKFVRKNNEIFLVLCGHVGTNVQQMSVNDFGNKVHEIMADYQGMRNGGDAFMRLLTFDLSTGTVKARTYSPWRDHDMNLGWSYGGGGSAYWFTLDLDQRFQSPTTPVSYHWISGNSGDWSDPENWTGGAAPRDGKATILNFAGDGDYTATKAASTDPFPFALGRLNFANTAGSITLSSSTPLALAGDLAAIVKTGDGQVNIAAPLVLNGVVKANLASDVTFSQSISGEGDLIKDGPGTMILSGYGARLGNTGNVAIDAGAIRLGGYDGVSGRSTVTIAPKARLDASYGYGGSLGGLAGGGVYIGKHGQHVTVGQNNLDTTFSGTITAGDEGAIGAEPAQRQLDLVKTGSGITTLTGASDFAGQVGIEAGRLSINAIADTGAASPIGLGDVNNQPSEKSITLGKTGTSATSAGLQYTGPTATTNRPLFLDGSGGTLDVSQDDVVLTLTGVVGGSSLVKAGSGTLLLSADNTYQGVTAIDEGTLLLDNNTGAVFGTSAIAVNCGGRLAGAGAISNDISIHTGGTLDLRHGDLATGAVTLAGGTITGTGRLIGTSFHLDGGAIEVPLGGSASLTKAGDDIALLTRGCTYSGDTTIAGGTLVLSFVNDSTPNRLPGYTNLTLAGGTLVICGNNSSSTRHAPAVQTLGGLALEIGDSTISIPARANQAATLNLGSVRRQTGGTLRLDLASSEGGSTTITTTSDNQAGILDAAIAFDCDWAATDDSGRVTRLARYAYKNDVRLWDADDNVTNTDSFDATRLDGAINSLRFDASRAAALVIEPLSTLQITSGGILVTPNVGVDNSLITSGRITSGNGHDLIIHQNNPDGPLTIASAITGHIGLTKSGRGTLVLAGPNDYAGSTIVNSGTLVVQGPLSLSRSAEILVGGKATLRYAGLAINTPPITVRQGAGLEGPAGFNIASGQLSTPLTESSALIKVGQDTLAVSGPNTHTGTTTIKAGTIKLGNPNSLSAKSALVLNDTADTTLDLDGYNQAVGSLSGGGKIILGSATLTVGADNSNTSFTGAITGTGGLAKLGAGVFTVTGAPTFTGSIAIDQGELVIDTGAVETTITQSFKGKGAFRKTGMGTLVASGSFFDLRGDIYIDQGALQAKHGDAFSNFWTTVNISAGATLDKSSAWRDEELGGLAGQGKVIAPRGGAITFGGNHKDTVFGGILTSGNGGSSGYGGYSQYDRGANYVKNGYGTVTLTGTLSDFSGVMEIDRGLLDITNIADRGQPCAIGVGNLRNAYGDGGAGPGYDIVLWTTLRYSGPTACTNRQVLLKSNIAAIDVASANATLTIAGCVDGLDGTVNKLGAGTLVLTGRNSYSGQTTISQGTLEVSGTVPNTPAIRLTPGTAFRYANATEPLPIAVTIEPGALATWVVPPNGSYADIASSMALPRIITPPPPPPEDIPGNRRSNQPANDDWASQGLDPSRALQTDPTGFGQPFRGRGDMQMDQPMPDMDQPDQDDRDTDQDPDADPNTDPDRNTDLRPQQDNADSTPTPNTATKPETVIPPTAQPDHYIPGSFAKILSGINTTATSVPLSMKWLKRPAEPATCSDILVIEIPASSALSPIVLALSYDPAQFAANPQMIPRLARMEGDTWENAAVGAAALKRTDGPFTDAGQPGLDDDIGRYGVDTEKHIVWAVVSRAGKYAVTAGEGGK